MNSKLPYVFYHLIVTMTETGAPVANLTFPDLDTAQLAVEQLNGQQHGNVHIRMQLQDPHQSLQQPVQAVRPPQAGMQPLLPPPPLPARQGLQEVNAGQAGSGFARSNSENWRLSAGQASGAASSGMNQVGQESGPQTAVTQPNLGLPATAVAGSQGQAFAPQPPSSGGTGPVTALVQQCIRRPELIQKIQAQFTGQPTEICKEFGDLKVKLNRMKVSDVFDKPVLLVSSGTIRQ